MKNKILSAFNFLRENSFVVSERLVEEIKNLENPHYKVAVVGEFQVGKSTLINRVFLKEEFLLKEGKGSATTCVPTEIIFSETKRLEIFPYEKNIQDKSIVIESPTENDIRIATSADNQETRAKLAEHTASVRLSWPCLPLRQFSIYDTPGINEPNAAVVSTTYKLIPEADVVIMLTACRQLSQIELEFMCNKVFDAGLSRVLLLISHNPMQQKFSQDARTEILQTVKAQIENIGRDYIPVKMFCYDETINGEILTSTAAIEKTIWDFLEKNVGRGRQEKTLAVLQYEVSVALQLVCAELTALNKLEDARSEFIHSLEQKQKEVNERFDTLAKKFASDLRAHLADAKYNLSDKIDAIRDKCLNELNACNAMDDLKNKIENINNGLQREVASIVVENSENINQELHQLIKSYDQNINAPLNDFRSLITDNYQIDGGLIVKSPSEIWTVLDSVLASLPVPSPSLGKDPKINALLLLMQFIKNIKISDAIIGIAKDKIKKELYGLFTQIKKEYMEKIENGFNSSDEQIRKYFNEIADSECQAVLKTVENLPDGAAAEERKKILEELFAELKAYIKEINQLVATHAA